MTLQELRDLLAHPDKAESRHLPDLVQLSGGYPYCGALHRLILIALYRTGDLRYSAELHDRIFSVRDPGELFAILRSRDGASAPEAEAEADPILFPRQSDANRERAMSRSDAGDRPSAKGAFDLIEDFLEEHPEDTSDVEALISPPDHVPLPEVPAPMAYSPKQETASEIIAAFLEGGDAAEVIPRLDSTEGIDAKSQTETAPLEEDYFTETLARIYIRQGKYDGALRIFKSLNLKYPKKSGYFAEQIAYLEKILKVVSAVKQ